MSKDAAGPAGAKPTARAGKVAALLGLVIIAAVAAMLMRGGPNGDPASNERSDPAPHSATAPTADPDSGHERKKSLLREFARQTPTQHSILGNGAVQQLRRQLAARGDGPLDGPGLDLLTALGLAELRTDDLEQGVEHLRQVHQRLKSLHEQGAVKTDLLAWASYRLGKAHMRVGETQNCCVRNTVDSCILPIVGGGVHTNPSGSRAAIARFQETLVLAPPGSRLAIKALWLLNVMYMTVDEYPQDVPEQYRIPTSVFTSEIEFPKFPNRSRELGLDSFDLLGGAVVEDFDGDDHLDVMVSSYDPNSPTRLFRGDGDGRFEDVSAAANLEGIVGGFNMVQADYDNDGDTDVLMLRGAWMEA